MPLFLFYIILLLLIIIIIIFLPFSILCWNRQQERNKGFSKTFAQVINLILPVCQFWRFITCYRSAISLAVCFVSSKLEQLMILDNCGVLSLAKIKLEIIFDDQIISPTKTNIFFKKLSKAFS